WGLSRRGRSPAPAPPSCPQHPPGAARRRRPAGGRAPAAAYDHHLALLRLRPGSGRGAVGGRRAVRLAGRRFRVLVFDVDRALDDSQHAILEVMATAFAGEGLACPTLEVVRRYVGLGIEETMVRLLPEADALLHRRLAQGFRE